MGLGKGNIGISQRRPISGAPFPANSADNGLSVDPVTGKIVLGNDTGATAAQLLSPREIPLNDQSLTLTTLSDRSVKWDLQADYYFTATNSSGLHRTERFMRAHMAKTSTGGTNVLSTYGRDLNNCVEVGHNMETVGVGFRLGSYVNSRGGAPDLNLNAGTAGRLLFTVNDNDPSAATLAGIILANGNIRFATNQTDNAAKFQVRGTGANIVNFETSGSSSVFAINSTGMITIAAMAARSSASIVMVRNAASGAIQGLTGFSGTILPTFTSITVVDGIITAVV